MTSGAVHLHVCREGPGTGRRVGFILYREDRTGRMNRMEPVEGRRGHREQGRVGAGESAGKGQAWPPSAPAFLGPQ